MASHWAVMNKIQFRLGVLVIFAAILLHNLTSPNRYSIVAGNPPTKVDRITGKSWYVKKTIVAPAGSSNDGTLKWVEIHHN